MTRADAVKAAAAVLVEADLLSASVPPAEAARRAYTPTGPAMPVLEARIKDRRGSDSPRCRAPV